MNINHTFQYLQMGLPERINRKKLFGDFEGALQDMESYLLTPDLPDAMRHCLTTEAEMLRRLPSDFPYTREEALAVARKEVPDFSEEEFDQLERKFRIRWIYQNGEKRYFDRFFENLCRTDPEMGRTGRKRDRSSKWTVFSGSDRDYAPGWKSRKTFLLQILSAVKG